MLVANPPYKKRWRHVDLKKIFPQILIGCKNIKTIFNEPYKFNQICLLSHEIFCWQSNVLSENYNLFYWRNRHVHFFQITVVFVFIYNNKAVYEHEKTANPQLTDVTGNFQLSLHAINANSLRNVFTINMPPSFLL